MNFEKPTESLEQQFENGMQEIKNLCAQVREASAARAVEAAGGAINNREEDIENDRDAALNQLARLLTIAEQMGTEEGVKILQQKREEHAEGSQTEMSLN